ncbi:hypothetical protein HAV15_009618 [Penicillium sp. str. |nr:hypothetical protein HAV15_009618 [Penicillium sp. str. \
MAVWCEHASRRQIGTSVNINALQAKAVSQRYEARQTPAILPSRSLESTRNGHNGEAPGWGHTPAGCGPVGWHYGASVSWCSTIVPR